MSPRARAGLRLVNLLHAFVAGVLLALFTRPAPAELPPAAALDCPSVMFVGADIDGESVAPTLGPDGAGAAREARP